MVPCQAIPDMSDYGVGPLNKVDNVELPLNIVTAEIEELGLIMDRLRIRARKSDDRLSGVPGGLLALAEAIYCFRRRRDDAFGRDMFSDPRWDMLLDLFIAGERNKRISVSSVCIGASCPATTALRHLSALVRTGLVQRKSDDADGRVVWVELSDDGRAKLVGVLRSWG